MKNPPFLYSVITRYKYYLVSCDFLTNSSARILLSDMAVSLVRWLLVLYLHGKLIYVYYVMLLSRVLMD